MRKTRRLIRAAAVATLVAGTVLILGTGAASADTTWGPRAVPATTQSSITPSDTTWTG